MSAGLAAKVLDYCEQIAAFSEREGEITRTFLCPAMHDCHSRLSDWMKRVGMSVRVDAVGNLRGLIGDLHAPRFAIGSHLDTVPNAGRYDGILGVVIAIALVELTGAHLPFALEVIGFSEEEGVRFRTPFLGSKGLVHGLSAVSLALTDDHGISLAQAIRNFDLDPALTASPGLAAETVGYLEFHIEQGPVLEAEQRSLAIVDSIAGQCRATVTFSGQANHAGTTPMPHRRDALAAAAEWISEVERKARRTNGLVATVGKVAVKPNGSNIIPGEVSATIDVRHAIDNNRREAFQQIIGNAKEICGKRGVAFETSNQFEQKTVPMNASLIRLAEHSFALAGFAPLHLSSGAGHDAMIVAEKLPSAMIFLRSPGGVSHHPAESVRIEDVENALNAGAAFLDGLRNWEPLSHGAA